MRINHTRGKLIIQNLTTQDYEVIELRGHVIPSGQTLDLLDQDLPVHYNSWDAANRAATQETRCQLYQDIQANNLVILESVPAQARRGVL